MAEKDHRISEKKVCGEKQMRYDYLIVGSGLFGAVFACEAKKAGKSVLVLEKRDHIGGNIYTQDMEGVCVHRYGAHIFHTDDKEIWDYINSFGSFNNYKHKVIANYKGEIYDLPFNMNTFHQMWGIDTPEEAVKIIDTQRSGISEPRNLEEQCLSMVGRDVYEKLVKGYTEKQWGRKCRELPSFIIKRLPVRLTYSSDYFDDLYQGIPEQGYTKIIEKMLEGIEVRLDCDYLKHRNEFDYEKLVFSGPIDAFFEYEYGYFEYRSLCFETQVLDIDDFQHHAVVNYTDSETPFTRIIEHKWFTHSESSKTVITKEYPLEWNETEEPYYPINDEKNMELYEKYKKLAEKREDVIFGGRLGEYKYYDMDEVIRRALECWRMQDKRA